MGVSITLGLLHYTRTHAKWGHVNPLSEGLLLRVQMSEIQVDVCIERGLKISHRSRDLVGSNAFAIEMLAAKRRDSKMTSPN